MFGILARKSNARFTTSEAKNVSSISIFDQKREFSIIGHKCVPFGWHSTDKITHRAIWMNRCSSLSMSQQHIVWWKLYFDMTLTHYHIFTNEWFMGIEDPFGWFRNNWIKLPYFVFVCIPVCALYVWEHHHFFHSQEIFASGWNGTQIEWKNMS